MSFGIRIIILVFASIAAGCGELASPNSNSANANNNNGGIFSQGNPYTSAITANDEYEYLNILRRNAGMSELKRNPALAQAALGHASYLATNDVFGHDQVLGKPGYTGTKPHNRVVAAGLRTIENIGEGIANGSSQFDAIDKLMSAIYHRFTLFDFYNDSIGMGFVTNPPKSLLVHNMANSLMNDACMNSPPVTVGLYYQNVCNPDFALGETYYTNALTTVANSSADVVLWPPRNGEDIPPVFFEETPDPLPDYSVSGYPISIQFNPKKMGKIVLNSFYLYDQSTGSLVTPTRQLDKATDPVLSFRDKEFALFPLNRLEWGTQYRVVAQYTNNGVPANLEWTFRTRQLNSTLKRITYNESTITIGNNSVTYLYFVPAHGNDVINSFRVEYLEGRPAKVSFIDNNTLRVEYQGNKGDTLKLTLNGSRIVNLSAN